MLLLSCNISFILKPKKAFRCKQIILNGYDNDHDDNVDNYNFTPEPFDSTDLFGSSDVIKREEAKLKEKEKERMEENVAIEIEKSNNQSNNIDLESNNYSNIYGKDYDDDDWVPTLADNNPEFIKFLKDTYIGTEFDSPRRKEARYVIRNITGISLTIGIIFTIIWYTFPGKFISYRGDTNFQSRYNTEEVLRNDFDRNPSKIFENTLKSDIIPTSPRYSNEIKSNEIEL